MSQLIPAASNALMIKHLEAQGFDKVYLDQHLVSTQLLGTSDVNLLSADAYVTYVSRLAAATDLAIVADVPEVTDTATFTDALLHLQAVGCTQLIISDANLVDADAFNQALHIAQQAITDDNTELIVKLDGLVQYGLAELQARVAVAEANGVAHILISNITDGEIAIIKAVATTAAISLILDNANIHYCNAEQLTPKFIFDTYHVYLGLTRAAKTISQDMVLKIFMG